MDILSRRNLDYGLLKLRSLQKQIGDGATVRVSGVLDDSYCFELPASSIDDIELASLEVSTFGELAERIVFDTVPTQADIENYDYGVFEEGGHVKILCNAANHEVGQNIVVDYR